MSETLPTVERPTVMLDGIKCYHNGKFLGANRELTEPSKLGLLPLYGLFARHQNFFINSSAEIGDYRKASVRLGGFMLDSQEKKIYRLYTPHHVVDDFDNTTTFIHTVKDKSHHIEKMEDGGERLSVFLELANSDQSEHEVQIVQEALDDQGIGHYRRLDSGKLDPRRPDVFLFALESPTGFASANVDHFMDLVWENAPKTITTVPLVSTVYPQQA